MKKKPYDGILKEIFKKLGGLNAKMIHIAGSKGKGTTAFLTAEALNAAGFKVGLFTSPAIFCYEEMIRVNMEEISTEALIELIAKLKWPAMAVKFRNLRK